MEQKFQLIEKEVKEKFQTVDISEQLEESFEKLTGIGIPENIGLNCVLLSSSLDGKELFPKNFEAERIQANTFVPPDERYFTLNKSAKGKKIEIRFQDGGTAIRYPYSLKIYLRLEKNEGNSNQKNL